MSDDSSDGTDNAGRQRQDRSLTERQRTILEVIRASVTSRGYPPSIREIGDAVGLLIRRSKDLVPETYAEARRWLWFRL